MSQLKEIENNGGLTEMVKDQEIEKRVEWDNNAVLDVQTVSGNEVLMN